MRPIAVTLAFVLVTAAAQAGDAFVRNLALSPDGRTLVFAMAGDLWAAPASGGTAARLTAHPADEGAAVFSPDGTRLAFESDRDGAQNLYVMDITVHEPGVVTSGEPRRVTFSDSGHSLSGFSAGGGELLFHSSQDREIYRHPRMYAVSVDGGPVRELANVYGHTPRMSADGRYLAFVRNTHDWNRPIYRGPASRDIFRLDLRDGGFDRVTTHDANDGQPFFADDNDIYFVSSRDGQNNIYRLADERTDTDSTPIQITDFAPGPRETTIGHGVRDLTMSGDGRKVAFAVWDTVYTLDIATSGAEPTPVNFAFAADDAAPESRVVDLSDEVSEARVSPDGGTVAMIARGEVIVRSTDDDRPGRHVTRTHARERDLGWSPDGRYLYFSSDERGTPGIFRASVDLARTDILPEQDEEPADDASDEADADDDAASDTADNDADKDDKVDHGERWAEAVTFRVESVIATGESERSPVPAPDGRSILFSRGLGDLVHLDFSTGEETVVLEGWNLSSVQWAGDNRHIVFARQDLDFNSDIFILDARTPGAEPMNITRHPDLDVAPRLSRDGKVLYFASDRDNENFRYDIYRVFLDARLDDFTDYELAEHFDAAQKRFAKDKPIDPVTLGQAAADDDQPEPFTFDAEDAYLRIDRVVASPTSLQLADITPSGDTILVEGSIDGDTGLHALSYRGRDRKAIQTGGVGSVNVNLGGSRAYFVRGGQARSVAVSGGSADTYDFDAQARILTSEEQRQKFREAAHGFGESFYHPTLKGLNWARLMNRYEDLAAKTRTTGEFNAVVSMLFGEVDGSHTGIRGGPQLFNAPSPRVGHLGIRTEPVPSRPDAAGHRVLSVLPKGPAHRRDELALEPGDIIVEIDGQPVDGRSMDELMLGKAGEEVLLKVERGGDERYVLLEAISSGAESTLRYEAEVARRRAEVDRLSGGTLGYLHIRGMNTASLRDYERDLYAAAHGKKGLIIDVRDNGGGSTTDLLLASLTAPQHAYTIPRGADPAAAQPDAAGVFHYPRDRRFIYQYQGPVAVLCNQNSFSNAEIFSHAIKNIGRGVLVGMQTYGGVISTGGFGLIDGTFIRRPFRGWYLPDGTDMENNGAMPDIVVDQTPQDEAAGRDRQLEAAVDALMTGDGFAAE